MPISGMIANVLIDPGSTHSFVSPAFISMLGCHPKLLDYVLVVSAPTSEELHAHVHCDECYVEIDDVKLHVDLILLDIRDFDVILGA